MFSKTNFNNLSKETTPHATGSRVVIANKEEAQFYFIRIKK